MDLDASFGDTKIYNDQILGVSSAKQPFNISIRSDPNQLSTLVIYDLSAPDARNPTKSPFIHFLEMNIPGTKIDQGDIYFEYMPPSPPAGSGNHVYVVDLFRQKKRISLNITDQRIAFPLTQFIQSHDLTHESRLIFRVNPDDEAAFDGQWTNLTNDKNNSYCRCVMEVAGRQPEACNREHAWYQRREGRKCANPYAVCHASIKGESGLPNCGQNYVFENIPDNELIGYASLNRINIPQPYNRQALIKILYQWEVDKKARIQQLQEDLASGRLRL